MRVLGLWASHHAPTPEQISEMGKLCSEVLYLDDINPDLQRSLSKQQVVEAIGITARRLINFASTLMKKEGADILYIFQPSGHILTQILYHLLLQENGTNRIKLFYSFSVPDRKETTLPDGRVEIRTIFKHQKFVSVDDFKNNKEV